MIKKLVLAAVLLAAPIGAWAQQQSILCSSSTACNSTTGPTNTGTGDPLWKAYGKVNANEAQLYGMFGATGLLKGAGSVPNALTTAAAADVIGLFSGTSDASHCLSGAATLVTCTNISVPTSAAVLGSNSSNQLISATTTGTGSVVLASAPTLVAPTLGAASATSLSLSGALTSNITGSTQCVHANSAGILSGTGSDCGAGGGSSAFSALTGGTNTAAAMVVGTGASLTVTGSGTIAATNTTGVNGGSVPVSAAVLGSNSSGQLISATTTGSGSNVLATSPTLVTPALGTPSALTLTNATGLPLSGLSTITSGDLLGNSGSGNAAIPILGGLSLTSSGLGASYSIRTVSGTTDTILSSDCANGVQYTSSSAVAVTLPQATSSFAACNVDVIAAGTGTVTVTPTTSTINSGSTLSVAGSRSANITAASGNYVATGTALVSGSGSGTVNSGTTNQVAVYSSSGTAVSGATTLPTAAMPALTGDVTNTAGSLATTVGKVNGAAVPTSASVLGSNSSNQLIAATTVSYLIDAGTTFTLGTGTGACATTSTLTGGTAAGAFTCTGTTGASTQIVNLPTAGHGWSCSFSDETTANTLRQSGHATTTATMAGTVNANDVVSFNCTGYK
jgi:hypothetical protein